MSDQYEISQKIDSPQAGEVYRHYKGGLYFILGISLNKSVHYEGESDVIYETEDGKWANRPLKEFLSFVEVEGESIPRFTKEVGVTWDI
jgi:hypothetical protein